MSSNKKSSQGFTLIEVMIALVVVALGLSAVITSVANVTDSTVYVRDRVMAEWVAQNAMAALRINQAFPAEGVEFEDVEQAGRRWRIEVNTTVPNENFRDINISVTTDEDRDQVLATLRTTLVNPTVILPYQANQNNQNNQNSDDALVPPPVPDDFLRGSQNGDEF